LEVRNQDLIDSQQQLRKAERLSALGEIAAGFVHEVRNPIAAMRGALDIVASRTSKNTPEAEFTDIARKELVRLDSLIGFSSVSPCFCALRPNGRRSLSKHRASNSCRR
jgi:nitrogen-specific signal transduction histidine kinase